MKIHSKFRPGDIVKMKSGCKTAIISTKQRVGVVAYAEVTWDKNGEKYVTYCSARKPIKAVYEGSKYKIFPFGAWFDDDDLELVALAPYDERKWTYR